MNKEFTAKKVDDAIKQGLAELGVTLDDVTVEVLDYGGFLRKAKVRLTVDEKEQAAPEKPESVKPTKPEMDEKPEKPIKAAKAEKPEKVEKTEKAEKAEKPEKPDKSKKAKADKPEKVEKTEKAEKAEKPEKPDKSKKAKADKPAPETSESVETGDGGEKVEKVKTRRLRAEDKDALERARTFIDDVTKLMGFESLAVTVSGDGETVNIDAPERDDSLIIGRHGETLSALGYLAETCIRAEKCHTSVTVDCNGYRGRRAASLSAMARRKAEECVRRRRKIKLEPMDRTDRRTVHSALNEFSGVTTASEGKEPYRCVVILPAGKGGKRQNDDRRAAADAPDESNTEE